jgi:hypothetical protein
MIGGKHRLVAAGFTGREAMRARRVAMKRVNRTLSRSLQISASARGDGCRLPLLVKVGLARRLNVCFAPSGTTDRSIKRQICTTSWGNFPRGYPERRPPSVISRTSDRRSGRDRSVATKTQAASMRHTV